MKPRTNKKVIWLITAVLTLSFVLYGCSSQSSKTAPFQIVFCSLYLSDAAVSEYGETLTNNMPELTIDQSKPLFTPVIMGAEENNPEAGVISDPMMGMAGIMKLSSMVASGEVDIVISDMDNAARNARGDMFAPLDEIFTADELADLQERLLLFDYVESDDGMDFKPTGETTPICGIDITGNEAMMRIFGSQEIGVFVVANSTKTDLAKSVILSLLK